MSSLIPSGGASGTGSVTLLAPNTNSTQTQTLPDATGTVMVSGNMPLFRAYKSTDQTGIANATMTKVTFDTVVHDTASNYSVANNRFTPTVAGYYQITAQIISAGTSMTNQSFAVYKNGSENTNIYYRTSVSDIGWQISNLVYMNGTTDYLEIYASISASSSRYFASGASNCWFGGYLARTA